MSLDRVYLAWQKDTDDVHVLNCFASLAEAIEDLRFHALVLRGKIRRRDKLPKKDDYVGLSELAIDPKVKLVGELKPFRRFTIDYLSDASPGPIYSISDEHSEGSLYYEIQAVKFTHAPSVSYRDSRVGEVRTTARYEKDTGPSHRDGSTSRRLA